MSTLGMEGESMYPEEAVRASERNSPASLHDRIVAFHERWYPQLAGTAIGEKMLGHEQSAERWGDLCKDWFEIVEATFEIVEATHVEA